MADELNPDVKRAYETLDAKARHYETLWNYYDGNAPLKYSDDRLKEVFKNITARFTQNWCSVVVDSVVERLELKQFQVQRDEEATNQLNDWFEASGLNLDADDAELCALVTGESYVITWPNEDGALEAYYNDSRMCHLFYDPENPRLKRLGAKWWEAESQLRLTLYYPDRLEYYAADLKSKGGKTAEKLNHKSFQRFLLDKNNPESWMAENPLTIVPMWHLRRETRAIKSELGPSILDMQDAINKLLNDMMVASEFGAFPQRYIISQADLGTLKNAPWEIWDIPSSDGLGQPTTVGQFGEAQLGNFMDQIEKLATAVSKMSRTPQYYFFLGARADPSGETLLAMDAPLVKKVESYIKRFRREWVALGRFVAGQLGLQIAPNALDVVYADPRTVQPKTEAETRKTAVESGIPLVTTLRRDGWTPEELAQLEADKAAEREASTAALGQAMLNQMRQFDQGGGPAANGVQNAPAQNGAVTSGAV